MKRAITDGMKALRERYFATLARRTEEKARVEPQQWATKEEIEERLAKHRKQVQPEPDEIGYT